MSVLVTFLESMSSELSTKKKIRWYVCITADGMVKASRLINGEQRIKLSVYHLRS